MDGSCELIVWCDHLLFGLAICCLFDLVAILFLILDQYQFHQLLGCQYKLLSDGYHGFNLGRCFVQFPFSQSQLVSNMSSVAFQVSELGSNGYIVYSKGIQCLARRIVGNNVPVRGVVIYSYQRRREALVQGACPIYESCPSTLHCLWELQNLCDKVSDMTSIFVCR